MMRVVKNAAKKDNRRQRKERQQKTMQDKTTLHEVRHSMTES
jgi:hypothetical protein